MENRLIIRKEYDPYMAMWKYVALYPDDDALPGRIVCQPFYFDANGRVISEPVCEMDYGYYICKTKHVSAKSDEVAKCLAALEELHDTKFVLREKITYRRN